LYGRANASGYRLLRVIQGHKRAGAKVNWRHALWLSPHPAMLRGDERLYPAIWLAESAGDSFYHEADGTRLCSLVKPVITYWVEYRETGPNTYEIFSTYYHRMRFREGE
jgi:hypothetical protein